jgi:cephalosporin hydroxylase
LAGLAIDNGALHRQFELASLFQIAASSRPRYLLEVGLSAGGTFEMWGRVCGSLQRIVGVDLVRPAGIPTRVIGDPRIKIVVGDSHLKDTVDRVRDVLPHGIDLLFIDGDHSYEGVKKDFEYFSQLVNRGGVIAIHDINMDYFVRHGRRQLADSGDVYKFWKELRHHYQTEEIIESSDQDGYGIGVIRWGHRCAAKPSLRRTTL